MADRTGLEPATSGVTGRHSNQLNYQSAAFINRYQSTVTLFTAKHCKFVNLVGDDGIEPPTFCV